MFHLYSARKEEFRFCRVQPVAPPARLVRPARHPPGRCCATFKSAPGGFVLLRRALTDKQQIKRRALSSDRALRFI
ncbi:hypothetical protein FZQ87_13990 [Salmonella enterica]|nr:hypothetical protein [Salmonella enterica]ECP4145009.1 hypothetical protein [Salmonella enterica]EDY4582485.1 hypothetical protein [Salmonella enterica]